MIKIPSVSQIRELDAFTIEEENITSLALMERAAGTVAGAIMKRWPSTVPVVVFAGPGNNGGDALVVARILAENAYDVEAFLINTRGRLSAECSESKERLKNNDRVRFSEVSNRFEPPTLTAGKLVIDGLFGTGLKEPLMGGFASLVKFINDSPATVISLPAFCSNPLWSQTAVRLSERDTPLLSSCRRCSCFLMIQRNIGERQKLLTSVFQEKVSTNWYLKVF